MMLIQLVVSSTIRDQTDCSMSRMRERRKHILEGITLKKETISKLIAKAIQTYSHFTTGKLLFRSHNIKLYNIYRASI